MGEIHRYNRYTVTKLEKGNLIMDLACNGWCNGAVAGRYERWYVVSYRARRSRSAAAELLDRGRLDDVPDGAWSCAAELLRLGVEIFCPMGEAKDTGKGRRIKSRRRAKRQPCGTRHRILWGPRRVSLIPGYLLVQAVDDETLDEVCAAQYVESVLRGASEFPVTVPPALMAGVLGGAMADRAAGPVYAEGETVRIAGGPLSGRNGVYDSELGEDDEGVRHLRIWVEAMGRFAPLSVPSDLIERI